MNARDRGFSPERNNIKIKYFFNYKINFTPPFFFNSELFHITFIYKASIIYYFAFFNKNNHEFLTHHF